MARLSYLLDSNILSEPSRQRPDRQVLSRLEAHRREVCTAAPILHEMRYGLTRMPDGARKRHLLRYMDHVLHQLPTILPYERDAALWHAGERARLESLGRTPPYVDGQIAAIAKVNDMVLVTRNTGDFVHFTGLEVENWFA